VRNRIDRTQLHEGMQVYSGEGQQLGTIEATDADSLTVKGQQYEFTSIERVEGDRVYLTRQVGASTERGGAGGGAAAGERVAEAAGEVRVPVREERLEVEKREGELGEVQVRRRIEQEEQTVPVELEREEIHVRQEAVPERPVAEGELPGAFQEGTIRVPVRGEEAVARKETVVTGEVVIDRERTSQTQQVAGTVRREEVEVDEDYARHRAAYQQEYAQRAGAAGRPFEEAEPHFRTGYAAARDPRYAGKPFEEAEPELRRAAGAGDESAWERIKREVREGFTRARER
jgi:uncharacterized protein (TIGR02271 family)